MEMEKQIDDLTFVRWRFTFINNTLYLDGYFLLQKESKRHKKFKVIEKYNRLMVRDNTLKESEVPFTDELKAEAINQFVSKIKVIKWSER